MSIKKIILGFERVEPILSDFEQAEVLEFRYFQL